MRLTFITFCCVLIFSLLSCAQSEVEEQELELTKESLNQKDENGVPVGCWEFRDQNDLLKERYFFSPSYENGIVVQRAKIEKYDKGVLNNRYTLQDYYDQQKNILVDTFQVFNAKGKLIIEGTFAEGGYAIGDWRYYTNEGDELIGTARVEIKGQSLAVVYTDYSENRDQPERFNFLLPMAIVHQDFETKAHGFFNQHVVNMSFNPLDKLSEYEQIDE